MSDMRARLVSRFRDIAADRLERINQGLVQLRGSPRDTDAAAVLKREIHTLKGEARMTGFRLVSDVAHRLEELLEGVGTKALAEGRVDALFAGFDLVEALIAKPPETQEDADVQAWNARASAALESRPEPAGATSSGAVQPPPPPEAPPKSQAPAVSRVGGDLFLRVSLDKLDQVTRVAGDLTLDHGMGERVHDSIVRQTSEVARVLREAQAVLQRLGRPEEAVRRELLETLEELRGLVERARIEHADLRERVQRADDQDFDLGLKLLELDERVRELRFLPLSSLFGRFPRAVHDLAREQGKSVELRIRGDAVELDKQVLDRIAEPLLHLVRNAVDHGIETPDERRAADKPTKATVRLTARSLGSAVEIEIEDDGRGVDADRVRARAVTSGALTEHQARRIDDGEILLRIFDFGLSTRDEITDISGRGVGLAVVKDTVEHLGGTVAVESIAGQGTRFRLRVPTSVVLARVLLVRVAGRPYALPVDLVAATRYALAGDWEMAGKSRFLRLGSELLSAIDLHAVLGVPRPASRTRTPVAIVEQRGRHFAVEVGRFAGQHQAVQRPIDPFLAGMALLQGSVGTPDGGIALLLSVPDLIRTGLGAVAAPESPADVTDETTRRILVVDDSEFTRDLVVQAIRDMGLEVVEAVNGRQGLDRFRQHRLDLVLTDLDMPVMDGFELLREIRSRDEGASLPVVVFSTRGSPEDKERAASLGADAYVVKTEFREAALRELVRSFLGDGG